MRAVNFYSDVLPTALPQSSGSVILLLGDESYEDDDLSTAHYT